MTSQKQIPSKHKPLLPWKCAQVRGLAFGSQEQLRRHKAVWLRPSNEGHLSDEEDDGGSAHSSTTLVSTAVPHRGQLYTADDFAFTFRCSLADRVWHKICGQETSETEPVDSAAAKLPVSGPPSLQEHLLDMSAKMAALKSDLEAANYKLKRRGSESDTEAPQSKVDEVNDVVAALKAEHAIAMAAMQSKLDAANSTIARHESQILETKASIGEGIQELQGKLARSKLEFTVKRVALENELKAAKDALSRQQQQQGRECPMCYERDVDSMNKCGHQFCGTCISKWQTHSGRAPWHTPCPVCRKAMGKPIRVFAL